MSAKFDEYWELYQEHYGDQGPSISAECGNRKRDPKNCGCWKCHLVELREWKRQWVLNNLSTIQETKAMA